MEIKRVAIIEPVGGHGGMDYYDYGLALGLASANLEVYYFTSNNTKLRHYNNVKTRFTFRNIWDNNSLKYLYFINGYLKSFINSKKLKIDIIHLHLFNFTLQNILIVLMGKLFHFKVILTIHDVNSFYNLSKRVYEKIVLILVDGIIVHNKDSLRELKKKGHKLPLVKVIPHGNYIPFITINKRDKEQSNEVLKLLFFGQIKEVKGLDILLKAMRKAIDKGANLELTIAGRPSKISFDRYLELIDVLNLGKHVKTVLKYIDDDKVSNYFLNSDLVVLPYKMISQSGVLLLTMSYGTPVLVSNLPSFIDIVKNDFNGYVFESENIEDLTDKLVYIFTKRRYLERITHHANETISNRFDWTNIGKLTKDFYIKILNYEG